MLHVVVFVLVIITFSAGVDNGNKMRYMYTFVTLRCFGDDMRDVIQGLEAVEFSREQFDAAFNYQGELLKVSCRFLENGISVRPEREEYNHPDPPFCRMFLFKKGGADIIVGGKKQRLEQGQIYLLSSGMPFQVGYDAGSVLVYFHLHVFDYSESPVFCNETGLCLRDDAVAFDAICEAAEKRDHMRTCSNVFSTLMRFVEPQCQRLLVQSKRMKGFGAILEYLNKHSKEIVSIGELAELFGVNANTLTKRFKRATGDSLKRFLTYNKLRQIQELLLYSNLSVVEISSKTGFSSSQYLQRFFRNSTGMTPAEFRKLQ